MLLTKYGCLGFARANSLINYMLQKTWHKVASWVDRGFYPYLLFVLIAADAFVVIIPTDGLLISSILLAPRKWVTFTLATVVGSTVGSLCFAGLVQSYGLPFLTQIAPSLVGSETWKQADIFFERWGDLAILITGFGPFIQQPTIALAALAGNSLLHIFFYLFLGRGAKYLIYAWIATRSPHLLKKLWGVKAEIKDVEPDLVSELPPRPPQQG